MHMGRSSPTSMASPTMAPWFAIGLMEACSSSPPLSSIPFSFYVKRSDISIRLIAHTTVKVNSSETLLDFDLKEFKPRFDYTIFQLLLHGGGLISTQSPRRSCAYLKVFIS